MKYDVHIYATVRIKVPGVRATSPKEAALLAKSQVNLEDEVACGRAEYADDITDFKVDKLDNQGEVTDETILDSEGNPK